MANTTIDTLLVRIETDLSGLKKGLDQVNRNVSSAGNQARDSFRSMEDGVNRVTGAATKLAGVLIAAVGASALGGSILGTIRQFEDLEAQLKSVTPNAEVAADAFELIRQFTSNTTSQLQEVTQAFIALASSGVAPTYDVLQDLGNLAAARGKNITDVAQAVQNAMTGEFEMLKSLGIVVRTEGDTITATFNGVSKTMQKSGIVDYLRSIGRERFGDALANQANTLSGRISNLQDAISEFQVQIGEAGLKDAMMELFGTFLQTSQNGDSLAKTIGTALASAVRGLNAAIIFLRDNMQEISRAIVIFFTVFAVAKVISIASAMFTLAKAITAAKVATEALNAVTKANPLLLLATALAAVGSQVGMVDDLIRILTGSTAENADVSERARKEIDALNASMQTAFAPPVAEAPKKFRDAIADLNMRFAEATLEVQGFTREQIAAAKAAGLLENLKVDGLTVSINAAGAEFQALNRILERTRPLLNQLGISAIEKQLLDLQSALGESDLNRQFRELFDPTLWASLKEAGTNLEGLRRRFIAIKTEGGIKDIQTQLQDMREEIGKTDAERFADNLMRGLRNLPVDPSFRNSLREEAMAIYETNQATEERKRVISEGIGVAQQFAGESFRIAQSMTAVTAAFDARRLSPADYTNAMARLNEQLRMTTPLFQSIENVISSATNTMTSALTSIFNGTAKARDAFRSMFSNIADMILQEVTRMLIVIPIMNAIRSALGMTLVPSFTPAMQTASSFTSGYSLAQPGVQLPSMRAGGGSVNSGMPTIVGERGPELFVPHSAGRIMNGNNTASMMRGGQPVVVNQTIEVTTGVQNTVRAEIQNLMPQIAEVTKAAVAQSAMRGGSYRRAFA